MPLGLAVGENNPLMALEIVLAVRLLLCQLYASVASWRTQRRAQIINATAAEKKILISIIGAFSGGDYSSLVRRLAVAVLQEHVGFIPAKETAEYERIGSAVREIVDHISWTEPILCPGNRARAGSRVVAVHPRCR